MSASVVCSDTGVQTSPVPSSPDSLDIDEASLLSNRAKVKRKQVRRCPKYGFVGRTSHSTLRIPSSSSDVNPAGGTMINSKAYPLSTLAIPPPTPSSLLPSVNERVDKIVKTTSLPEGVANLTLQPPQAPPPPPPPPPPPLINSLFTTPQKAAPSPPIIPSVSS